MRGFQNIRKNNSNQTEADQPKQEPVEVARLHKPLEQESLIAEARRMSEFGRAQPAEVASTREQNRLDRNTLDEARERGRIKADSLIGFFDKNINPKSDKDDTIAVGVGVNFSWGDPEGTKFNAGIIGIPGSVVTSAISAAGAVTNGTKAGDFFYKIDVDKHINKAIAERTGWEHDPNIDTRSGSEIALSGALSRAKNHEKWSAAARKENFSGYNKADSAAENSTRYVVSLLEPSFAAFKNKNPRISEADLKSVRSAIIEQVLSEKPYPDSALQAGLKKLILRSPSSGTLENGKLSAETKSWVEGLIKDEYSNIRENRNKN